MQKASAFTGVFVILHHGGIKADFFTPIFPWFSAGFRHKKPRFFLMVKMRKLKNKKARKSGEKIFSFFRKKALEKNLGFFYTESKGIRGFARVRKRNKITQN